LTKQLAQSDVYLLTLDAEGQNVSASRQLTTDTQVDWPAQWTRDASSFLFISGLFLPRPSPDGRSLLIGVEQTTSNVWVIER
jgi:hypothetical protein